MFMLDKRDFIFTDKIQKIQNLTVFIKLLRSVICL